MRIQLLLLLGFLTLSACSDEGEAPIDAGRDGGADAAAEDARPNADASPPDATAADAAAGDAELDAGAGDDAAIMDAGTSTAGWPGPSCRVVMGTAGVTFTFDEGRTLAPTQQMLSGVAYTYGLAALSAPGVILAVHDGTLLRSTDSGCSWQPIGALPGGFPVALAAAGADRAYAWSDNNPELYRIDGTTITALTAPVDSITGLAVDPNDPDRIRLAGRDGQIYESTTAGVGRFSVVGVPPFSIPQVYRVAFDPRDLDRATAGTAVEGAAWTEDGGASWTPVRGLSVTSTRGGNANVFSVVYSRASRDVIWYQGIDLSQTGGGVPGDGRHIWRSSDAGRSARVVITESSTVTLTNGTLLAPHPRDPGVLYFVFGTYFQGYGTDLFRYDATTDRLTLEHNGYHSVDAIEFSPSDPSVMFLGLTNEQIR